MPVSGHVVDLVTADVGAVRDDVVGGAAHEFFGFVVLALDGKDFD